MPWAARWSLLLLIVVVVWASACGSLAGEACGSLAAGHCDTLKEVRRKNKQLRVQLKNSPWPDLKCFSANRQTNSLPLQAKSRGLPRLPSKARMAYLAGFFDGDG